MKDLLKGLIAGIATACIAWAPGAAHAEPVQAPLTCEDAPEYMPAGACEPQGIAVNEAVAYWLSDCTDGREVFIDPATGGLYGDQDENGRLDGDDCNWS